MSAQPIEAIRMPTTYATNAPVAVLQQDLSVQQVVQHVTKVREIVAKLFIPGVHYGVVPGTDNRRCPNCGKYRTLHDGRDGVTCVQGPGKDGCGSVFAADDARVWVKKSLYQPGVDTLCLAFKLAPEYRVQQSVESDPPRHLNVLVECVIRHAATGLVLGTAWGSASTRETKWGQVSAQRRCPQCQAAAIKVSSYRDEAGNFYCYDKLGGCGAKYDKGDVRITKQPTGKVWREEMGDVANTVLKMAIKRAKVAAVLTVTAASDAFEQDLEDLQEMAAEGGEKPPGDAAPTPPPAAPRASGPAPGAPTAKVDTGKRATKAKAKADDPSPLDRLVATFGELGVTVEQLERKLGHPLAQTSGKEFDELRATWQAIMADKAKIEVLFPAAAANPTREPGMDDEGDEIPLDPPQRRDDGS